MAYTFFFLNDTAPTEISPLSLPAALPICAAHGGAGADVPAAGRVPEGGIATSGGDRKSTRLNSSHQIISYAVFCLKKKNTEPAEVRLTRHDYLRVNHSVT